MIPRTNHGIRVGVFCLAVTGFLHVPAAAEAGAACTFDVECETAEPCTAYRCDIDPGSAPGSGVCVHTPVPAGGPGRCDDGLFCNGLEFCSASGQCTAGAPAACCTNPPEYCTDKYGRCRADSLRPGDLCASEPDCGGVCEHCLPVCLDDADCDDGRVCNGIESCVDAQCVPGVPPCGEGADCSEDRCKTSDGSNELPLAACVTDEDCLPENTCEPGALCFIGRCCSSTSEPECTIVKLNTAPPADPCLASGGSWYAGDFGREDTTGFCGGTNPNHPGVSLGCPRYGSGIAQTTPGPPGRPVRVGPVSGSPLPVPAPNGPGEPFYRLGDDYLLSDGAYMALSAFRFYGEIDPPGPVLFEFWDSDGHLVADVPADLPSGDGIHVIHLEELVTIPPAGYVTAAIAIGSPNARLTWWSTETVTVGGNDSDKLFVNDDPNASNFMSPSPGILSFELVGESVVAPSGACCLSDGSCVDLTAWKCVGQEGHFQGVGNLCPGDGCATGACCEDFVACSVTTPASCKGTFLGAGSDCDPDCCDRRSETALLGTDCSTGACYTGADHPADAVFHILRELSPGDPPITVTITGDNTYATSSPAQPDPCFGPAEGLADDAGWFEALSVGGPCTMLRVDYCCSEPPRRSFHPFLARDAACTSLVLAEPHPYTSESAEGTGPPYCEDGNAWSWFGPVPFGDLFIPVPSSLLDPRGPYQLHVTAEACPQAACCLPDGGCEDGTNQLECDALGGVWLGPPRRIPLVPLCAGDACATGSCCLAPEACEDEQDGAAISRTECEETLNGTFHPGLKCEGGTCALDDRYSCNDAGDCTSVGGACDSGPGGEQALAQPNPCVLCPFETASNCQLYDSPADCLDATFAIADRSYGSGLIAADDFIPGIGLSTIDELCAWGLYLNTDPSAPGNDCGATRTADNFRVRVLGSDASGLPDDGNVIGSSGATAERAVIPGASSIICFDGSVETYGFHLVLDEPMSGLNAGETYWLEVTNELDPADQCAWMWVRLSGESQQGNDFSMIGSEANGYRPGAERAADQTFCLPGRMEPPASPVRPCCACGGGCSDRTLEDCREHESGYQIGEVNAEGDPQTCSVASPCPADARPENDDCANATDVGVGAHPFSIHCATTDGHELSVYFGSDSIDFDVWFTFHAPQDCLARFDMCASSEYDSMVAVYSDGSDVCPCPVDDSTGQATLVDFADEGCNANIGIGGSGFLEVPAAQGQCFTVRVGNWNAGGTRGTGVLDISCGPPTCGDNVVQPSIGEVCDGIDDSACPDGCNPPGHAQECRCAPAPVCGNGVREGSELCDPGNGVDPPDDDACPGLCANDCVCPSACGNEVREGVEECDGPDDASCGGVPGRCNPDCTCPPAVCGNDFRDPGEECDGSDTQNCLGDLCRSPADPTGGCTCPCGSIADLFPAVEPELDPVGRPRFMAFNVTDAGQGDPWAIRVRLDSLYRPAEPPPDGPDFSNAEGGFRYVNAYDPGEAGLTCPDSESLGGSYKCARLGCQPEYRDWAADLAGATLHVSGDAVVPSSAYSLAIIDPVCGPAPGADECTRASAETMITTGPWGDITGPGNGPPDGSADVLDIGAAVDKAKGLATALPEHRIWHKHQQPQPDADAINVLDIGFVVDAVKGLPYPFTIGACP